MPKMFVNFYNSVIGCLKIVSDGEFITSISFEKGKRKCSLPIFEKVFKWFDDYFDKKQPFEKVPVKFFGTPFQIEVWNILQTIPFGESFSYGQIAKMLENKLGKKVSPRAVGHAVGQNKIAVIVPCHRVIGAKKGLTGYAWGIDKKRALLSHENIEFKD